MLVKSECSSNSVCQQIIIGVLGTVSSIAVSASAKGQDTALNNGQTNAVS